MASPDERFSFDRFRLDPEQRRLFDGETEVRLRDKVFDTLLFLVRNSGRLLTKEELIDAIWPDHHVEESNLNHNISVLRKTLGDSTDAPRFIQTVPKRGFRFIAEVRRIESDLATAGDAIESDVPGTAKQPATANLNRLRRMPVTIPAAVALLLLTAAAWAIASRHDGNRPGSVTVMQFRYFGAAANYAYIASSLSETLSTRLGAIGGVVVRPSPDSVSDVREAARASGADFVIRGAVQCADAQNVRITAEVYDAKSGTQIWSRQFDAAATDVLVVEDAIATAVGDRLRPGLTQEERARLAPAHSKDPEAVDSYVRGRDLLDRRISFVESEQQLEHAVKRDPQFAAAWAALAEAKMYPQLGRPDIDGAIAAAHRALRLDPSLAEAHAALGFINFFYRWDWAAADRELRAAIQLNPGSARAHDWYALTLAVRGNIGVALRELEVARRIEPQSLDMAADAALLHLLAHDFAGAELASREVLRADPSSTQARAYLIDALIGLQRFDEAIAENASQTEASPLKYVSRELIRMQAGRPIDKDRLLTEVSLLEPSAVPPEQLAAVYAQLGERDRALAWLERAVEQHSFGAVFAAGNDSLASLRSDPRFTALLRRIGIAEVPAVASMAGRRSAS